MAKLSPITQDLILRSKAYQQGMADANKKLKTFRGSSNKASQMANKLSGSIKAMGVAALGAAGVGGLGSLIRSSIAFGSSQSDVASQLGINTVAFQVYTGAIKDAGGSQQQMEKSILAMQQAVVQGDEGMTTFTRAFSRLGLNIKQIRGLAPEAQFEAIAKAVANAKDQQGALTAVTEIFGKRNAPQLIEVMKRLNRDGFGAMAEEIRKTYGIMDAETQRRLDTAADRIEQFKQKATINVGELIAGEGDGAAVKILTAQLLGATAKFSVGLLEGIYKLATTIPTFIGGAMEGVANKFGFSLKTVAVKFKIALQEAANTVILKLNELTGANVQTIRVAYRELAEEQAAAGERIKNDAGILETATNAVIKLWNDEPLKGWKDDIDAGTKTITDAYKADLTASRQAAAEREKGAKKVLDLLTGPTGVTTPEGSGTSGGGASAASAKIDDGMRGKIRTGKIMTGKINGFASRFGPMPTMDQREAAAGLRLAGGDPLSGRRGMGADLGLKTAGIKNAKGDSDSPDVLSQILDILKKLDGALSNA